MRPPMLAGPIERKWKFASSGFSDRLITSLRGSTTPVGCWITLVAINGAIIIGMANKTTRRTSFCIGLLSRTPLLLNDAGMIARTRRNHKACFDTIAAKAYEALRGVGHDKPMEDVRNRDAVFAVACTYRNCTRQSRCHRYVAL